MFCQGGQNAYAGAWRTPCGGFVACGQTRVGTLGYEATSMSGIAQLAGASIGSLYQFFPSKESIGSALLLQYMNELSDRLEHWKTALPSAPRVFGQKLVTIVFDYASQRPACHLLADTPSLVPQSYGIEKLSGSVQELLSTSSRP
jgi:AcrR family transcriptional regulator